MVSKAKYEKLITSFLKKWENILSKDMVYAISDLWKWIKEYPEKTGPGVATEDVKLYVKRGINLLKTFADEYHKEFAVLSDALTKCKLAILRNETTCTIKTKTELTNLIKEYNSFTSSVIGCVDTSSDFLLGLFRKVVNVLGDDGYVKRKDELENICFSLKTQSLKL